MRVYSISTNDIPVSHENLIAFFFQILGTAERCLGLREVKLSFVQMNGVI